MNKYKVRGTATRSEGVVMTIKAENKQEALEKAKDWDFEDIDYDQNFDEAEFEATLDDVDVDDEQRQVDFDDLLDEQRDKQLISEGKM